MKKVITLTENDLVRLIKKVISEQMKVDDSEVSQFIKTPNKLVILDFTAEWCGPCQKIKKHFDEIIENPKLSNKFILGSYDFSFSSPLAKKYNIQGIPYVMFFRNGKMIHKFVGYKDKEHIVSLIQKL
jgi:thioredoxin 1